MFSLVLFPTPVVFIVERPLTRVPVHRSCLLLLLFVAVVAVTLNTNLLTMYSTTTTQSTVIAFNGTFGALDGIGGRKKRGICTVREPKSGGVKGTWGKWEIGSGQRPQTTALSRWIGTAFNSTIAGPNHISMDAEGGILIAARFDHNIRRFFNGLTSTIAGSRSFQTGTADGVLTLCRCLSSLSLTLPSLSFFRSLSLSPLSMSCFFFFLDSLSISWSALWCMCVRLCVWVCMCVYVSGGVIRAL